MTTTASTDFYADAASLEPKKRSARLREAVRTAGGNRVVADKAGIALSTLGEYLAGGEQKLTNTIALAKACDVSLEWLATGEGPIKPGETAPSAPPPPPEPGPRFLKAFGTFDAETLSECYEAVVAQLRAKGVRNPRGRRIFQATLLLYDELIASRAANPEDANKSEQPD